MNPDPYSQRVTVRFRNYWIIIQLWDEKGKRKLSIRDAQSYPQVIGANKLILLNTEIDEATQFEIQDNLEKEKQVKNLFKIDPETGQTYIITGRGEKLAEGGVLQAKVNVITINTLLERVDHIAEMRGLMESQKKRYKDTLDTIKNKYKEDIKMIERTTDESKIFLEEKIKELRVLAFNNKFSSRQNEKEDMYKGYKKSVDPLNGGNGAVKTVKTKKEEKI